MQEFQILHSDIVNGLVYAAQSLNFTYNRMNYPNDEAKRFCKIRDGVIMEHAAERVLREHYKVTLISSPFKTDYRTTDSAEFVLMSSALQMLPLDLKGFHVFRSFQGESRTPESLRQQGWALVPTDQFHERAKPVYIFLFMLALSAMSRFIYHVSAKKTDDETPMDNTYKKPVSVGISFLDVNRRPLTKVMKLTKPMIKTGKTTFLEIDCLFGFDPTLKEHDIHITDALGKHYVLDKAHWASDRFGVTDGSLCFAGWATDADIKSWKIVPRGSHIFPYSATQTENHGVPIHQLRPMEDLQSYLAGR